MIDWDQVASLIIKAFNSLRDFIASFLAQTIFKARPDLAQEFGSVFSLLVTLTALYLILTLITAAKKVVGIILAIGWLLAILSIVLKTFVP